jgi:hypothetical protein
MEKWSTEGKYRVRNSFNKLRSLIMITMDWFTNFKLEVDHFKQSRIKN